VDIGQLVSNARRSAGRTIRSLGADADVAGSTITRIQSGTVDPSVKTLARILDAAGFTLVIDAVRHGVPRRPRLADLIDAWSYHRGRVRLDWTRWRAILDRLALQPELVPEAIYLTPPPSGEPIIDALLAAVAEKLADDATLPRPAWTYQVPVLTESFRPPLVRAAASHTVPPQLEARGLLIDTESLWRSPETIGV
jgi:transcriptional regulator with XRE-family HTH domain